jgi:hypothetical protein
VLSAEYTGSEMLAQPPFCLNFPKIVKFVVNVYWACNACFMFLSVENTFRCYKHLGRYTQKKHVGFRVRNFQSDFNQCWHVSTSFTEAVQLVSQFMTIRSAVLELFHSLSRQTKRI